VALTVDTFSVIIQRLITYLQANTSRITDYNRGSVIRTLLEAVALEMDKLYYQLELLQNASFIKSAAGDDLDAKAQDFGLTRIPATKATVTVRLSRLTPAPVGGIAIPAGSIWSTLPRFTTSDAVQFTNAVAYTIPAGDTFLDISVEAVVAGQSGNVLATEIVVNSSNVEGVDFLGNPLAATGGDDIETDAELRSRISLIFRGNNAGTEDNYKSVLLGNTLAVVSSVSVVGPGEPLMTRDSGVGGKVDIYFKGNALPTQASESFLFVNGTDYNFSPYIFDPPDYPNARLVPVNSIVQIQDLDTLDILVAGTDYTFVADATIFGRSDRAQDKIAFANMPTRNGHTFQVTFFYDKTVGDLRAIIESWRPITADVLIKEGLVQSVDARIKPFYAPGIVPSAAQAAMTTALQDYINEIQLGGTIYVTEALRRMAEVKVNGLLAVIGFDKTQSTIYNTGVPTSNSVLTVDKNTYFSLNAVVYL
jgi:hypothetical protein